MTLLITVDRKTLSAVRDAFRNGDLEVKVISRKREYILPIVKIVASSEDDKKVKSSGSRRTSAAKAPVQTELPTHEDKTSSL
jgi:hypothetical protein